MSKFFQRECAKLKGRWTALLVLVTCCVVTVVVAQQGETIDHQRALIQLLWGDSRELNGRKVKDFNDQQMPKPAPDTVAPEPPSPSKPPTTKPRTRKPKPPQPSERQAIERPGPRLLRYI